jgi:hypothetical protein
MGKGDVVRVTLEIPDAIHRRAKSRAAEQGISLRQFITEAVAERLQDTSRNSPRLWMRHFGKLRQLRTETRRINKIIEDAFDR